MTYIVIDLADNYPDQTVRMIHEKRFDDPKEAIKEAKLMNQYDDEANCNWCVVALKPARKEIN